MPHIGPRVPAAADRPSDPTGRAGLRRRSTREPAGAVSATAATTSARRWATSSACSCVGASTITRTSCSVPEGRSSTRPESPSSASTALTASATASLSATAQPIGDGHVDQDLRQPLHDGGELGQGGAGRGHPGQQRQPGQQAVARRGVVEEDQVAALLAAEAQALRAQRLEHVAVTDGRGLHRDAGVAHRVVEAEVAHHRGHDGRVLERARARASTGRRSPGSCRRRRRRRPPSTARHRSASPSWAMPMSAPCSRTVSASGPRWVEPTPSLMFQPSGSQPMACTVAPARRYTSGAACRRGAVGAVDDDPQAGERLVDGGQDVAGVVLRRARAGRGRGRSRHRWAGGRRRSPLTTVRSMSASSASGSLCPPRLNSLMPLSGIGLWLAEIMTPRSASCAAGEVGERRRGDDARAQHLGAGAGQAGHHRGLEHLPAGAGVTADDRDGTRGPVAVGEHSGGGARHREGQLRRQVGVGPAADAVRPEQATQRGQRLEY